MFCTFVPNGNFQQLNQIYKACIRQYVHIILPCCPGSLFQIRLDKNYRSTRCIIEAASFLIQNNAKRSQTKRVLTDNSSGSKVNSVIKRATSVFDLVKYKSLIMGIHLHRSLLGNAVMRMHNVPLLWIRS